MNAGFGPLSTLTLLGAAQGAFLALALLNTRTGDVRAHRILALLTCLFSVDLAEEFLFQIGFFETMPDLLQVLAPIDLLALPALLLAEKSSVEVGGTARFLVHSGLVGQVLFLDTFRAVNAW